MKIHAAFEKPENTAVALLCLSWLIADGLAKAAQLDAKLSVPAADLHTTLASLMVQERDSLKQAISQRSLGCGLPCPFTADELGRFLDFIARDQAAPRDRTNLN